MGKVELTFEEKIVEKSDLYREDTNLFKIEDINLDKIELSKKKNDHKNGQKNCHIYIYIYIYIYIHIYIYIYIYIGYDDNDEIVSLFIKLPQMVGYYNIFKSGKTMNFICDDKDYLENIKKVGKIRSKPTYESNKYAYINRKIREFGGVITTNFYKNKVSKASEEKFPSKRL